MPKGMTFPWPFRTHPKSPASASATPPRRLRSLWIGVLAGLVLGCAGLDAQYWEQDSSFAPVFESSVLTVYWAPLLPAPGGKVLVPRASIVASINGVRSSLFRLTANGAIDPAFTPPADDPFAPFAALAVYPDGRVLVSRLGAPSGNGTRLPEILRLKVEGTIDGSFTPAALDQYTSATAQLLANGKILLTGAFSTVSGVKEPSLCILNDDGTVSTTFHSPFPHFLSGGDLGKLVSRPTADGRIFVVGPLDGLGPPKLGRLARLLANGTIDATFNCSAVRFPASAVNVFPQPDGHVLVAYGPTGVWTGDPIGLLRLDSAGALDATFNPQTAGAPIGFGPMSADGSLLYTTLLQERYEVRRLKANGAADPAFILPGPPTAMFAPMAADDGTYFFTAPLTDARQASHLPIAHVFADGRIDPDFNPRVSAAEPAAAFLQQPDGKILVAGAFDYAAGERLSDGYNLVRLTAAGAIDPTFHATLGSTERVRGLRLQPGGKIIASGTFEVAGQTRSFARFNADGTRDLTFQLPDAARADLTLDAAGRIYAAIPGGDGSGESWLKRYTSDGSADTSFPGISLGMLTPSAFTVTADDKLLVTTTWQAWPTLRQTWLRRFLSNGSLDPSFPTAPNSLPDTVASLVAIPGGSFVAIGSVGQAMDFCRFSEAGKLEYRYRGHPQQIEPGVYDGLEIAGALLDALRAAVLPVGSPTRTEVNVDSFGFSMNVGSDGRSLLYSSWLNPGLAAYRRTTLTSPSVAPAPVVYEVKNTDSAPVLLGGTRTLVATVGGLFPLSYQWMKDGVAIPGAINDGFMIEAATAASAGNYSVMVSNTYGSATSSPVTVSVNTVLAAPQFATEPPSQVVLTTSDLSPPVVATGNPIPKIRWWRNGFVVPIPSVIPAVPGVFEPDFWLDAQPYAVGRYTAVATNSVGSVTSTPMFVGFSSPEKVVGAATEVGPDTLHPTGRIFDQCLLTGIATSLIPTAASITADPGQVTRLSYVDWDNDIVQVEFSGAGTLTLSLLIASPYGPVPPVNYHQPGVKYMGGHAAIVIAGADETTNLSVFTVGRLTAVDQSLFRNDVTYDGVADLAYVAILSRNGKFGGLRCANANFYATRGITGVYAPNVEFTGPVYIGDINAMGEETPMLILGLADGDTLITGGDLAQVAGRAVQVSGLTRLRFVDGMTSHGVLLPAQANKARLEQNGVDVTAEVVVNPTP